MTSADVNEGFSLAPQETKTITITVPLNVGSFVGQALPQSQALQGIANALGKVETVANALDSTNYQYFVNTLAFVEGKKFTPSKRVQIQMLRPGELGTGINLHT